MTAAAIQATKNLVRIMECPICFETFNGTPVYQCHEGHILCSKCIEIYTEKMCPTCGVAMPKDKIRNRVLEFFAANKANIFVEKSTVRPSLPAPTTQPPATAVAPALPKKIRKSVAVPAVKRPKHRSIHEGFFCDGEKCNEAGDEQLEIRGIRFKCTTCVDYDLCEDCIGMGVHKHHVFLRFATETQFLNYQKKS